MPRDRRVNRRSSQLCITRSHTHDCSFCFVLFFFAFLLRGSWAKERVLPVNRGGIHRGKKTMLYFLLLTDPQLMDVKLRAACCTNYCDHWCFFLGSARYEGSVHWDHYLSSLGSEPVTEEQIYEISPDVGRNWKDLLRNLSIKEKTIENLSVDFMHEKITEQCIQGLIKWKHRDPQLATVKTLATALRNVGCFDALRTFQKQRWIKYQ